MSRASAFNGTDPAPIPAFCRPTRGSGYVALPGWEVTTVVVEPNNGLLARLKSVVKDQGSPGTPSATLFFLELSVANSNPLRQRPGNQSGSELISGSIESVRLTTPEVAL